MFVLYPLVTTAAFEGFPCYEFEGGRAWLIADVSIECGTPAHDEAVGPDLVLEVEQPHLGAEGVRYLDVALFCAFCSGLCSVLLPAGSTWQTLALFVGEIASLLKSLNILNL